MSVAVTTNVTSAIRRDMRRVNARSSSVAGRCSIIHPNARRAIRSLEGDLSRNLDRYLDEDSDEHRRMVEWVCAQLHVTTLRYQRLQDMIEAIGLPEDRLCTYCWTGKASGYRDVLGERAG